MLKKRPREILDIQSCTFNSISTRREASRSAIQHKLADDRAYHETLIREMQSNLHSFSNRLFDEISDRNLIESREMANERMQQRREEKDINEKKMEEMQKFENEKILEEKRKLQILQNSNEFQDFERQLKRAQTAKEQAEQIFNVEAERKRIKENVKKERARLEQERELFKIIQEQQRKLKQLQSSQHHQFLQKQIDDKKILRQNQNDKQKNLERQQIEAMLKEIQQEERRAVQKRLQSRNEVQKTFEDYWTFREQYREKEKTLENLENRKMVEHLKQQQKKDRFIQDAQNERYKRLEELKERTSRLLREEQQRKDLEEIKRMENQAREMEEKYRRRDQEAFQFENQRRMLVRSSMLQQMKRRENQLLRELAEEEKYRQMIQAEIAREHMKNQIMRPSNEKQLEYLRELQRMMGEMKLRKTDEKMTNEEFLKQLEEQQRKTENVIQTEKQRILREQLADLWGHLPKSVSKSAGFTKRILSCAPIET